VVDQLRVNYYTKILGESAGRVFAEFETSRDDIVAADFSRRVLEWIQTMHPDDRTEAIRLAGSKGDLEKRKEAAVQVITRKNRLEIMVNESHAWLERRDSSAEQVGELKARIAQWEPELAEKQREVETLKEELRIMDADFRRKWYIYVARYGEP
jgi:hypothetical protein